MSATPRLLRTVAAVAAVLVCAWTPIAAQTDSRLGAIKAAAADARKMLESNSLKPVDVSDNVRQQAPPPLEGEKRTFFAAAPVADLLNRARDVLEKPLLDQNPLFPLRSYLQRYYPNVSPLAFPRAAAGGRGGGALPQLAGFLTGEMVRTAIARARAVADAFESMPTLVVDLTIESRPAKEAVVDLQAVDGTRHTGTTNTTLKNVYRGIYTYVVSKPGAKQIVGELNLVNDSRPVLDCQLAPMGKLDGPYPCNRR